LKSSEQNQMLKHLAITKGMNSTFLLHEEVKIIEKRRGLIP